MKNPVGAENTGRGNYYRLVARSSRSNFTLKTRPSNGNARMIAPIFSHSERRINGVDRHDNTRYAARQPKATKITILIATAKSLKLPSAIKPLGGSPQRKRLR